MAIIRGAELRDEPFLRGIDLATWTTKVSPADAAPVERPFFDSQTEVRDVLVAEESGFAVGYVLLHQTGPLPAHGHVLMIHGLAVDRTRQGQGIGRQLLDAAVTEAVRRGAHKLSLRVLAPNAGARRLYERCGFEVEGVLRREFFLDGEYVDDVLMARNLI